MKETDVSALKAGWDFGAKKAEAEHAAVEHVLRNVAQLTEGTQAERVERLLSAAECNADASKMAEMRAEKAEAECDRLRKALQDVIAEGVMKPLGLYRAVLSEAEAWAVLAMLWERPDRNPNGPYVLRDSYGLCDAIGELYWGDWIDLGMMRAMDERIRQYGPSNKGYWYRWPTTTHRWPTTTHGARQRARFCWRMAALAESEEGDHGV